MTVYFGPIGNNARTVIDYFERNGVRPCKPGENPAEWLLEVSRDHSDMAQKWQGSGEKRAVKRQLDDFTGSLGQKDACVANATSP